jgi:peptidoglycan/xylan/chitin deacetylase (PgdA/CDA1 family)
MCTRRRGDAAVPTLHLTRDHEKTSLFHAARALRALSLLASIALVLALLPFTAWAQPRFSDVPDAHWARGFIDALATQGFVSGYAGGSFRPNASVSRAEYAAMLLGALGTARLPTAAGREGPLPFVDVAAGYWARDAIFHAWRTGFMSGYPDNRFQPAGSITRQEVLVSLSGGLGLPTASAGLLNHFEDASEVGSWARDGVARAIAARLAVSGESTASRLRPRTNMTRAETVAAIHQARRQDGAELLLRSPALQGSCSLDGQCAVGQLCEASPRISSARFCQVPARSSCNGCSLAVLMYHEVVSSNASGDQVSRPQFRAHLQWLRANGYRSLKLDQAVRYMITGRSPYPGSKLVLLTFDDAYIGNFTQAFPELRDQQMHAVFFAHTGVNRDNGTRHMTWDQLRAAQSSGWVEVHSHTRLHPSGLGGLPADRINAEFRGALEDFRRNRLNHSMEIAYPEGSYSSLSKQIAARYHRSAFRVSSAPARLTADPLAIPRIGINAATTPEVLAGLLARAPVD